MNEFLAQLDPYLRLATPWAFALGLALTRTAGVMLALPQIQGDRVPKEVKASIAVALASSLVWIGPLPLDVVTASSPELAFVVAMIGELTFGLALGFVVHLMLATVRLAGEMIGIEMGLSFAAVADPLNQSQTTPAASFLGQLGVQTFLALGLDRMLVRGMAESVRTQPLGHASLSAGSIEGLMSLGDTLFRAGVNLALPVIGAIFALKLTIALLARVAQKLHLFVLAFTLTILMGQIVLAIAFPSIGAAVAEHLQRATDIVHWLVTRDG